MPRATTTKTYPKKSSSKRISVELLNALFAGNLQKRNTFDNQSKKVKVVQLRELPPADEYHHLIADSFENPYEDAFDKLTKTSHVDAVLSNKQVTKTNLKVNTSNTNDNYVNNEKKEDILDKSVVNSLSIEKVSLNEKKDIKFSTLSSYSDDSNLPKVFSNTENQSLERSYKPIFTKQFRDNNKKIIIASTPALLTKTPVQHVSIINELSPIFSKPQSKSLLEKSYDEIHTWNFNSPKAFESCVGTTPKIKRKGFKHKRKSIIAKEKQLKKIGNYVKNCIFNDDKLKMEPTVSLNKMLDILGISNSVKLRESSQCKKLDLSTHTTNSCSNNSDNVKNNVHSSPKTPVRFLNLRKRVVPITVTKSNKLKRNIKLKSHDDGKSSNSNSVKDVLSTDHDSESPQTREINEKVIENEVQQEVERFGDIVTPTKKLSEFYKQLSIAHTSPNQLMQTPELDEEDGSSYTLHQKSTYLRKISLKNKSIVGMSNPAQEIKCLYNDEKPSSLINVSPGFPHLPDSNISEFPKKNYVRKLNTLQEPNSFENFITKLTDYSTPKTTKKSCQKTTPKNVKNCEFSVTTTNNICENQVLFNQSLPNELQDIKTTGTTENVGYNIESKRKTASSRDYNQTNVSHLNSNYENEMSVNGNENLRYNIETKRKTNSLRDCSQMNALHLNSSYQNEMSVKSNEKLRYNIETKRKTNSLRDCSQTNVSHLNSSDENEMSVNSNEKLRYNIETKRKTDSLRDCSQTNVSHLNSSYQNEMSVKSNEKLRYNIETKRKTNSLRDCSQTNVSHLNSNYENEMSVNGNENLRHNIETRRKTNSLRDCSQTNVSHLNSDYENEMSVNSNENLRYNIETRRKTNSLRDCSQTNVSHLNSDYENEMSVNSNENLRYNIETRRKTGSLRDYSQTNVSHLNSSDENEMSVNSNEELLLRNRIESSSMLFSEDSHFARKFRNNNSCSIEDLEKSQLNTRDISNDEKSIASLSLSAGEDRDDEPSSNYVECNNSLPESINKQLMSDYPPSDDEDDFLVDVNFLIEKSGILSTREISESSEDIEDESVEENLSHNYISNETNSLCPTINCLHNTDHSYCSNKLEVWNNTYLQFSLNESNFVENSQIDSYNDESENDVIVISDQEDASIFFNNHTNKTSSNIKDNGVDVIEVFSSDEEVEVEPMNSSEESLSNSKNISDNNILNNSENSLCNKLNQLSNIEEDVDISYASVDQSNVNKSMEKERTYNVTSAIEKPLILKTGKSWRRSLIQIRKKALLQSTSLSYINETGCCCSSADCIECNIKKDTPNNTLSRTIFVKSALSTIRQTINSPFLEFTLTADNTYGPNNTKDTVYQERTIVESFLDSTQNKSIYEQSPYEVARSIVLRRCGQEKPIPFKECYSKTTLANCRKIGEGVYGEVFLYKNSEGSGTVMKVIPIEGNQLVNDEPQKKFSEILSEIVIAMELCSLRNNLKNNTSGFSEVKNVHCVQGKYPEKLLDLWELYDETHKSENDSPEMFGDDQLYIVLELSNGGSDMESFEFKNADEAFSLFKQIACTLAVAEQALEFEHRDLHWGNILIKRTDKNKMLKYCLNGREFFVPSNGIEVSIIDFTLSRVKIDNAIIYNDISKDPDLFSATGEYQFEVYKLMQQKNNNEWEHFEAYTNVLWMHYVIHKMITALRYSSTSTKTHKIAMHKLIQLEKNTLKYTSVDDLVNNEFIS